VRRTGVVGCEECYERFRELIAGLVEETKKIG
jgi:protein-arginine kinase activator protein McsA